MCTKACRYKAARRWYCRTWLSFKHCNTYTFRKFETSLKEPSVSQLTDRINDYSRVISNVAKNEQVSNVHKPLEDREEVGLCLNIPGYPKRAKATTMAEAMTPCNTISTGNENDIPLRYDLQLR